MKTTIPAHADRAMRNSQEHSHFPPPVRQQRRELTLDIAALEQAASETCWLTSQHQMDAVVSLASEWLRNGEPQLAPDQEVSSLLKRLADHQVAWKNALAFATAQVPPGYNRECLLQLTEVLGFAARVGERVSKQSVADTQRLVQIARMMNPDSKVPTAYFKRPSPREPLRQCRSTDLGAMPMYLDPQVALDTVVEVESRFSRYKSKIGEAFGAPGRAVRYVRQAVYDAWHPYTGDEADKYA